MYELDRITQEELNEVILNYVREYYDYDTCDNFGDTLQFTLYDGKIINIYVNIESESD